MTGEQKKTAGTAIASLVTGILSFLCCGPFTGIPAIICGHIAKKRINEQPDRLTGGGLALAGLILGYVNLGLSILIIPLYAAIAIPAFVKARDTAQKNACINNLRMLDAGKQAATLSYRWGTGTDCDTPTNTALINQFIKGNTTPICPKGGRYTYGKFDEIPTCTVPGHELPKWSGP